MTTHTHTTTPLEVRDLAVSIRAKGNRIGSIFTAPAHTAGKELRDQRRAMLRALAQEATQLARMI